MAVFLIGTLVVVLGIGSLALNLTWLTSHQVELRQASEAAALAGAAQLLDPAPGASGPAADAATAARVAVATDQARSFFSANSTTVLQTTGENSDVIAGWCEDPTTPRAAFVRWTGVGPVDALSVRGIRRRSNGQAVVLWFGNLFGVSNAEPAAAATATMDQRIYGFRPLEVVNVPMMPLLVLSTVSWPSGGPGTAGGQPDSYTVESRTGAVSAGADGVAEITLRVVLAGGSVPPGQTIATWLILPADMLNAGWLELQVRNGLDSYDLAANGGQLALGPDGTLLLSTMAAPTAARADALLAALSSIRGQKRIWPVGNLISGSNPPTCQVTGFVAGRVVDCTRDSNSMTIVVQACTIQTCTGLLRSGTMRNPWIGKLILNE